MVRIKTIDELRDEFSRPGDNGEEWRLRVRSGFITEMDFLSGRSLRNSTEWENIVELSDQFNLVISGFTLSSETLINYSGEIWGETIVQYSVYEEGREIFREPLPPPPSEIATSIVQGGIFGLVPEEPIGTDRTTNSRKRKPNAKPKIKKEVTTGALVRNKKILGVYEKYRKIVEKNQKR